MTAHDTEGHLDWGPEQLRHALDAAGVAMWSWNVDTDVFVMDPWVTACGTCRGRGHSASKTCLRKFTRPTVTG